MQRKAALFYWGLALGGVLCFTHGAQAATIIWTNVSGGNWNVAANWNPNQVPGPLDSAIITNNGTYTVTVNGTAAVTNLVAGGTSGTQTVAVASALTLNGASLISTNGALTLSTGSLGGTGGLTVLGSMNWSGGTLNNGAAITIAPGGALDFSGSGSKTINGALTNAGTARVSGSGSLSVNNNNGGSYSGGIYNLPGALFSIQNDQAMACACFGYEFFNNAGTLRKSGTSGTTVIGPSLINTGTLDLQSGLVSFTGAYTNSGGAISLTLTNPGAYGRAAFSSALAMTGTLNVSIGGTYQPAFGDQFTLLTYPSRTGAFTYNLPAGTQWQITNGPTALSLAALGPLIVTNSYTWTGAASSDWFTPSNWSPPGVPALYDTVNFGSGTIVLSSPVTIGGQFNWAGGTLAGSPLVIASNAVLNITGSAGRYLYGALTNAGTVNWLGGSVSLYNYFNNAGPIVNLPGGLWNIQCDQTLANYYDAPTAYFDNAGTVQKTAASGTTALSVPFHNRGAVAALAGTLSFQGGGTIDGPFSAAGGAAVKFAGGSFTYTNPPALTGPGAIQLAGGSLTLLADVLPGLQMTGGAIVLGPGFQGGTITNLALAGATLSGNYTVSGLLNCGNGVSGNLAIAPGATLNWTGGDFSGALSAAGGAIVNWSGGASHGPILVASNAVLNLTGTATRTLYSSLTNAGTVNWLGGGVTLYNYFNNAGPVVNLPGALWSIQCDQTLGNYYEAATAYFDNAGTVQKTAGTGTTTLSLPFVNRGLFAALAGTLSFADGGMIDGAFSAAGGAAIRFANGAFTGSTTAALAGPGAIQFTGDTLALPADVVPGLALAGGTVTLGPNFQGGTITNLSLPTASLSGNYSVSGTLTCGAGLSATLRVLSGGTFNWTAGDLHSPVTVGSNGVMNITGSASRYLYSSLTNAGTLNWLGGSVALYDYFNNAGPVVNLPGALWSIQCDQSLATYFGPSAASWFENDGAVQKSGSTGTTSIGMPFYNTGTLSIPSGTINFTLADSYTQAGASLSFGVTAAGHPAPLVVNGRLALDGTLTVALLGGYSPKSGDTVPLITCGTRTNGFQALSLPAVGSQLGWRLAYAASGVSLQVISNAQATAQITGSVTDTNGLAVTNVTVFALSTNAGNIVYLSTVTDNAGQYALSVTNGSWQVGLQGLPARGYDDVPAQDVVVDNANQIVNFTLQPYSGQGYVILVNANPPGAGTVSGGGVFLPGNPVTLTATANTNVWPYFFANWTENGLLQSTSATYAFAAQRSRQLVANFSLPTFTIAVSNNPPPAGTVIGAGSYFYGSTNVLTAQPGFGYNFGWWSEGGSVVSTAPSLTNIVYTNHAFVANYTEANTNHFATAVTQPPGLSTVTGAGVYTNGQSATFTTPGVIVSGEYDYFFQKFVLTNTVVSTSNSFTKTFSTLDATNLQFTVVYVSLGIRPVVTNVAANMPNPVPATTNFQLTLRFDRTMDTNFTPQITLTNSAPGAVQPVVSAGGRWSSVGLNNNAFTPPPITLTAPMSGMVQVYFSGAQDPLGVAIGLTNVYAFVLDATPPVLTSVTSSPAVLTAFITWTSDEPASSLVEYGPTTAYGSSSGLLPQLVTAHGVTLYSLTPLTTYHYRVRSHDLAGNETVSADDSFTTFAAPDLQVAGLSVSGNLMSGGNVMISWADTNAGSGATFSYWLDQVTMTNSTGQTVFNSSVYYDPGASGNIAPGASRSRSVNVQLPNGASGAGNLGIVITANVYHSQYEANGGPSPYANNSAALAFTSTLAAYPDLQIIGLAVTNAQVQSGNRLGLTWNEANSGNNTVSNLFYDQVLIVNQTSGQTLLNNIVADNAAATPIGAGQSAARQLSFVLPDGAAGAGTLQITVTADYYNNIFEYNGSGTAENNNPASISASSVLAPYPDILVTNVAGPASAGAGQPIQVTWTDANIGNAPATNVWTDQIFLADNVTLSNQQLLGSFTFTNGLGIGGAVTNTQTVTLPIFGSGDEWLVVKADAGHVIFELDPTNNTGVAAQPITLAATLALSIAPSTFVQNAANPAAVGTVTRSGNTSSNLLVLLAGSDASSAAVPASLTIPSGQSAATFALNAVPGNLVRGTRQVTVSASAGGYGGASNVVTILDNNIPTLSAGIGMTNVGESYTQPIPCSVSRNTATNAPLAVTLIASEHSKLSVPASVTIPAGAWSVSFNAYVINNALPSVDALISVAPSAPGYASVAATLTLTDDDLPPLILTLADAFITENAANPASQGTVAPKTPSPLPLTLVLQSDSPLVRVPPTLSLTGNQTSVTFPINVVNDHLVHGPVTATVRAYIADALAGTSIASSGVTSTIVLIDDNGAALSVALSSGTISEDGSTPATVQCNFTPTTNLLVTLASSDTGIATAPPTTTVLAGQTSASFTVSGVNPGVPTGPRRATISASAPDAATGVATVNVSDVNLPDLRVTGITLPSSALALAITNLSYSVVNSGIWAATNEWVDKVYYSSSPSGANLHFVGQVRMTNALAIGQSYTNTVTLFLPSTPGQYYVLVNLNPAQTLAEISYANNNLISATRVDVQPDYRATVTADVASAPSGTPIPMHGYAYSAANPSQLKPFVPVTIRVLVNGTRRVYSVNTDAGGNFSYQFVPLSTEAGSYELCADHPAVDTDTIQSGFALYGMRFGDGGLVRNLYPGMSVTGQVMVQNLGNLPLSGLSAVVEGVTNFTMQLGVGNGVPASGATALGYVLQAGEVTSPVYVRARIHATSAEGAAAYYPLTIQIAPQTPVLRANPNSLADGMLRGAQRFVTFDLVNEGGVASGPIQMLLPAAPWLASASGTNLPSLGPGETNRITLSLTPGAGLALQPYTGAINFNGANASLSLPFNFRAISDAAGSVAVTVQDDYTFYVAGGPLVSNAVVTLRDPYSNTLVASGTTGSNGIVLLPDISEGAYQLSVTADRHNSFQIPITVQAGHTNDVTAFIQRQTVTYQWTVVPTTIQDTYRIELESVFETEVPIPVVTIDNPLMIPLVIPGEDTRLAIKVSNHGLIAAQGVHLELPTGDPAHEYVALATNLDTIPAMSTISIPIVVRAKTNAAGMVAKGFTTDCPSIPKCNLKWGFICGNDMNWHAVEAELVPVDVDKDCADYLEDLLKDEIKEIQEKEGDWKDLLNWKDQICKILDVLETCLGLNKCVMAALRTGCGLVSLSISDTISSALGFGNCFCYKFEGSDEPDDDPVIPPIGLGSGIGASSGNLGNPGFITSPPAEGVFAGCTPGQTLGNPTGSIVGKIERQVVYATTVAAAAGAGHTAQSTVAPKAITSPGAVCAQVRIKIDQQAVVARAAFLGTLTIDNGDPNLALTNVQVTLDIRDVNQNPANAMFGINGPELTQLTGTDGTGVLAGGATGSAKFTFVPTHDAAPAVATLYRIGGTLQYYQGDSLVQVPLLPQQITVFPDPILRLLYFQQRDVYADDPFTPETEPSEPFDLGLMVKNSGYGKAFNFTITSGQPQIVDNEKGLLINFSLIGTKIGSNSITPSLAANLGQIEPGAAKVAVWEMVSTLQGRFKEFSANFQHQDNLGNPQTSLIDGVEIHELIHTVLANRPGDDSVPDFLVNDSPDPDNLPDTLYLSDGTVAPVTVVTNGTFDGAVGVGHLQVHLSATVSNGWNYVQLPDPGVGYILQAVVRSDGKMLAMTNDAWTTDRSFPSAITGAIREHLVHLFDYSGSGSYTLFYHSTNTTPPALLSVGPITPFTQSGAISSVSVLVSEAVDTNSFRATNVNLSLDGGLNLIPGGAAITLTLLSNTTYSINGLAPFCAADGNYQLTVNGPGILDLWGNNAGSVSASTQWAKGNVAPVVQSISPISPNPRNTPVSSVTVTFSKAVDSASFGSQALSLTRNAGPNLITSDVTLESTPSPGAQSSTSFVVNGLGPLTGAQGSYALVVSAASVQDTNGTAGVGSQSAAWSTITTGPTLAALEQVATNPRNTPVRTLNVTLSEPIDPASFDYHVVGLTRDGGPNLVTSDVTVTQLTPTTFQVGNLSWVQGYSGMYSFTINAAGFVDLAGNSGIGSTNEPWQIMLETVDPPTNLALAPDLGISSTDGLTSVTNLTLAGALGASNLTVRVFDQTIGSDLATASVNGSNFNAALSFGTPGSHHLRVTATDIAGNVSAPAFIDLFLDVLPPTATIQPVASPIYSAVSNIVVTFSEPINLATLSASNFVVTVNGSNAFTPTLTALSSNSFLLGNLAAYTYPLGSYRVALNCSGVQDFAGNQTTNVVAMSWVRGTTNLPPLLSTVTNVTVPPGTLVSLAIPASDLNGDQLNWSLAGGAPPGARIGASNGLFRWIPPRSYAESSNAFAVVVADNGSPAMSATQSFAVIVGDYLDLSLGSTNVLAGQGASLPIYLDSSSGVTSLVFSVQAPESVLNSWTLTPVAPQITSATLVDQATNLLITLGTAEGQPLQGNQMIARLNFVAAVNPGGGIVPVPILTQSGLKPTGAPYSNTYTHGSWVAVIQDQPLLIGSVSNRLNLELTVYGKPGVTYEIQYKTNVMAGAWLSLGSFTLTDSLINLSLDATNPSAFYRLVQQ